MLVHRRVTPSIKFTGTHLYTWVERGTVTVKCLVKNTAQCPWPGLEPRLLDTVDTLQNNFVLSRSIELFLLLSPVSTVQLM